MVQQGDGGGATTTFGDQGLRGLLGQLDAFGSSAGVPLTTPSAGSLGRPAGLPAGTAVSRFGVVVSGVGP
jgi:hypothetical protein